jgi:hypothetical protein
MKYFGMVLLLLLASLSLFSCVTGGSTVPPAATPAVTTAASPSGPVESVPSPGSITIENGAGRISFLLIKEADGYLVKDDTGAVAGKIKVESDRIKVKNPGDQVVYKLKKKDTGCKVLDGKDNELLKIKGTDGNYKIKDARDNEICRIKMKGEKLEIYGTASATVKSEGSAFVITDSSNKMLYRITGDIGKNEASFLGIYEKEPLQRLGMMIYFKMIK